MTQMAAYISNIGIHLKKSTNKKTNKQTKNKKSKSLEGNDNRSQIARKTLVILKQGKTPMTIAISERVTPNH